MTVYIGIDWSENKHDVCFLNEGGEVLQALELEQSLAGYQQLEQARARQGAAGSECVIGIETSHNVLLDYLNAQGYRQIYVLPPNAVKSAQGRYRQSGAKSDRRDARLIADILRVDRSKYQVWIPDSDLTRQIRGMISLVDYLTPQIWQTGNRLRATLMRYYPNALEVFSSLDSPISLAWIQAYPSPEAARSVDFKAFQAFAKAQRHTQPKKLAACYARLQAPRPAAADAISALYAQSVFKNCIRVTRDPVKLKDDPKKLLDRFERRRMELT